MLNPPEKARAASTASMTPPPPTPIVLLGPQRFDASLPERLAERRLKGPFAVITAGWQERESEDEELAEAVGSELVNLALHRRADRVFRDDPSLAAAHRARQDRLRGLQDLYRVRVNHAVAALRAIAERPVAPDLIAAEREDAMAALRRLEDHHLEALRSLHAAFHAETRFTERAAVARERDAIADALASCQALLVAGGHIAVLLNRMRLFSLVELIRERPIFAWSAGAMAMTERVVVFHDSPPQGPGNAELLDEGLGLARGVIVLPDARHRLRLRDPARVEILARRFAPSLCVALDEPAWVEAREAAGSDSRRWIGGGLARRLGVDGSVTSLAGLAEGAS
jgi:hypothetical protein